MSGESAALRGEGRPEGEAAMRMMAGLDLDLDLDDG